MASRCSANGKGTPWRIHNDSVRKFQKLKQACMKQQHSRNQHPSKQTAPKLFDNQPIPEHPPLYHTTYRKEIRLIRYLNQHHQFICALEPCFTTIVPFLTIDDLTRLSSVCGILNNWVMAETVPIYLFPVALYMTPSAHHHHHAVGEREAKKSNEITVFPFNVLSRIFAPS